MTNRIVAVLLIALLVLAGCGGDSSPTVAPATATIVEPDPTPVATSTIEPTATQVPDPTSTATSVPTATVPATATTTATAEPTEPVPSQFPDTPAGRQVDWFLGVLNSSDEMTLDEFNEHFAPSFASLVTYAQLVSGLGQVIPLYAPFEFTEYYQPPTDTQIIIRLTTPPGEEFLLAVGVEPEEPYLIEFLQLVFASAVEVTPDKFASWDEVDTALREFGGQSSLYVAELTGDESTLIYQINSWQWMSVASAFKLYVLGELARQVEAGIVSWDDELAIRDEWKSLPSGIMQNEPAGTVFTLREYAEAMISISDNTATDHLLHHLGRENVEAFLAEMDHAQPELNTPILTTREFFLLKLVADPTLQEAWASLDAEERRRALNEDIVGLSLPEVGEIDWLTPRLIQEVGWFASTEDVSMALEVLREMKERPGLEPVGEILSINPGLEFDPAVWTFVGFKGGSEPGVLNLSWLLQRVDGRWFTLVLTVNNEAENLDDAAIFRLAGGAVTLLSEQP